MSDIVVFGAGQIAEVAKVYIDAHGEDRIVGFTVDAAGSAAEAMNKLALVPGGMDAAIGQELLQ